MKTIFKIIAIALISTVFSCAKDDEVPPSLIGKWEFDKQIDYIAGAPEPETDCIYNISGCKKGFFEFKNNNTMAFGRFNNAICGLNLINQRYLFDGKSLQFKEPVQQYYYEIKKLTPTDLIIDATDSNAPIGTPNYVIQTFILKRIP